MAIKDPNIAAGFAALASALIPNSQGLIEADLARYKRDGLIADTNRTNVDATRLAADRARLQAEADRTNGYIAADKNIAAILADPGFNPADPAWRAKLAAASAGVEGGLSEAAPGMTGAATFINPNFAGSPDAFANILMGTGVVDDYGKTQPGFTADLTAQGQRNDATIAGDAAANAADNTRALDVARIQAQAEMDRLKYATTTPVTPGAAGSATAGAGKVATPLTIKPGDSAKFAEAIAGQIEQLYPGAVVDPALLQQLTSEATTLFQTNRNADAAIAEVLSGLTATTQDESWWPTGDTTRVQRGSAQPAVAAPPAGPSGAPAAPTAPASSASAAPITATDANGRKIMFDPATNQWVPLGPVRAQP